MPIAFLADRRHGVVYSLLAGAVLTFEIVMRPYSGHPGDVIRALPHAGFARAYGHEVDHVYTAIDRLILWAFVCYWWIATIITMRGPAATATSDLRK